MTKRPKGALPSGSSFHTDSQFINIVVEFVQQNGVSRAEASKSTFFVDLSQGKTKQDTDNSHIAGSSRTNFGPDPVPGYGLGRQKNDQFLTLRQFFENSLLDAVALLHIENVDERLRFRVLTNEPSHLPRNPAVMPPM
jgi:hypothetical protein